MEQPCSRCGYISDRPARFCRQCGSQLFAESDVTAATTRNYSQQQPPQFADQQPANYTPVGQGYSPGSWAEQTANTSPFYQASPPAQYQPQVVEPKKNFNWGKWVFLSFITFLLLAVLMGGALFWWGKQAVERAISQAQESASEPVVVTVPPVPDAPPPPGGPASETINVKLDDLKYPGAAVVQSNKFPLGAEITLTTNDDLETVKQYYDKKVAELFKNSDNNIQSTTDEKHEYVIFGQRSFAIKVTPDLDGEKTRIVITQIPIPKNPFPKGFPWKQ